MQERINRQTDERLYQPKIHSDRIKELYLLKLMTGIPLTVLVDKAIQELIAAYEVGGEVSTCDETKGDRTD